MKTKSILLGGVFISTVFMLSSCEKTSTAPEKTQYASIIDVASDGTTTFVDNVLKSTMDETTTIDSTTKNGLLQIKDDEKLARDVYTALNAKWNNRVFANITRSESNHLSAILLLLSVISPEDSTTTAVGVFTNPTVQKLYNNLVAAGSVSLIDALKVGATIEDLDIRDLTILIAQTTDANTKMVYDNLLKGSRNHLRAFTRQLTFLKSTYTPQYISQDAYNQIITSPFEKGIPYRINCPYVRK